MMRKRVAYTINPPLLHLLVKVPKGDLGKVLKILSLHKVVDLHTYGDYMAIMVMDREDTIHELRAKGFRVIERVGEVELFPPIFFDKRAVIFSRNTYEAFIKGLRDRLGSSYNALLYHIGAEIGRYVCGVHAKASKWDTRTLINILKGIFAFSGFGVLEVYLRRNRATIRVHDCFECELMKGDFSSHFIRGILAGWFSTMFKTDITSIEATEIRCIAKGDAYCEIVITRSKS